MKVTAPADFGFVVAHGGPVAKGEEIEVDAEHGARLVEQGWTSAVAKAARRTAAKKKAAKRAAKKAPRKRAAKTTDALAEADGPAAVAEFERVSDESEAVPESEPEADAEADPKENA